MVMKLELLRELFFGVIFVIFVKIEASGGVFKDDL
jgi:hypothetical protein